MRALSEALDCIRQAINGCDHRSEIRPDHAHPTTADLKLPNVVQTGDTLVNFEKVLQSPTKGLLDPPCKPETCATFFTDRPEDQGEVRWRVVGDYLRRSHRINP
jgi:hypothetical protein